MSTGEDDRAPKALMICSDLFFTSKVTSTGKEFGIEFQVVFAKPPSLEKNCAGPYSFVVLDLESSEFAIQELLESAGISTTETAVLAFGSHVNVNRLNEAKDAGCKDVMPRSRFSAELPQLLQDYANDSSNKP